MANEDRKANSRAATVASTQNSTTRRRNDSLQQSKAVRSPKLPSLKRVDRTTQSWLDSPSPKRTPEERRRMRAWFNEPAKEVDPKTRKMLDEWWGRDDDLDQSQQRVPAQSRVKPRNCLAATDLRNAPENSAIPAPANLRPSKRDLAQPPADEREIGGQARSPARAEIREQVALAFEPTGLDRAGTQNQPPPPPASSTRTAEHPEAPEPSFLISLKTAANILAVHPNTIRNMIDRGQLEAVHISRSVRLRRSVVMKLAHAGTALSRNGRS